MGTILQVIPTDRERELNLKAYEYAKDIKNSCTNMIEVDYIIHQIKMTFDVVRNHHTPLIIAYPLDRWGNRIKPDSEESGNE